MAFYFFHLFVHLSFPPGWPSDPAGWPSHPSSWLSDPSSWPSDPYSGPSGLSPWPLDPSSWGPDSWSWPFKLVVTEGHWRGLRASWRGLRASWRGLRASQQGLSASQGLEGWTDKQTKQFYRISSSLRATALLLSEILQHQSSRARKPLTKRCRRATGFNCILSGRTLNRDNYHESPASYNQRPTDGRTDRPTKRHIEWRVSD